VAVKPVAGEIDGLGAEDVAEFLRRSVESF